LFNLFSLLFQIFLSSFVFPKLSLICILAPLHSFLPCFLPSLLFSFVAHLLNNPNIIYVPSSILCPHSFRLSIFCYFSPLFSSFACFISLKSFVPYFNIYFLPTSSVSLYLSSAFSQYVCSLFHYLFFISHLFPFFPSFLTPFVYVNICLFS
jgi:hypothetical protein